MADTHSDTPRDGHPDGHPGGTAGEAAAYDPGADPAPASGSGRAATLLLVPGAWHRAAAWDALLPHLEREGVTATALELPGPGRAPGGHDLPGHAAYLRDALQALPGPVVVCAHSYGGAVVTEAAVGLPDVVGLVYLAAFQLEPGESCADANTPASRSEQQGVGAVLDGDYLVVPDAAARVMFYEDCTEEQTRAAVAALTPEHLRTVTAPVSRAAWHDIASTYIVCERDAAISSQVQTRLAARARRVRTLDSAHSPMLSHPRELAVLLADEVRRFSAAPHGAARAVPPTARG